MKVERQKNSSGVGLLLVDDDPGVLEYLSTLTNRMECNPVSAANGAEALKLFRKTRPGVVVLDYMLPDITGDDILREIKKESPITQVIIITGYGKYELAVKLLNGGASDYLKKPLDNQTVIDSIRRAYIEYQALSENVKMTGLGILIADEDKNTFNKIRKKLSSKGYRVYYAPDIPAAREIAMCEMPDIVIMDADFCGKGHGFECMERLKNLPFTSEVIIVANEGTEMTAIEALKRGAVSFLRKPEDIEQVPYIIENTMRSLNLKRLFNLKMHEFSASRNITARVTDDRNIEISLLTDNSRISSSFALRLLDNIPISVALIEKDMSISYKNRSIKKFAPALPDKLERAVIKPLKAAGISDVTSDVIKSETLKLLSGKEDIETVILGRMEFLTLTSLKIINGEGSRRAVLMVIRGN